MTGTSPGCDMRAIVGRQVQPTGAPFLPQVAGWWRPGGEIARANRLCLLGNVDLNLPTMATPDAVAEEVRGLIRDVGPGGGYIVTSGNSLAHYCEVENVYAMRDAVHCYGDYPPTVG